MNSKHMKIAGILLVAFAILGTAGAVSAIDVGTLSINLSHGEITKSGANYTGYIEFTPLFDYNLSAYKINILPNDSHVTFAVSDKTDELFTGHEIFENDMMVVYPSYLGQKYCAITSYNVQGKYVVLAGNVTHKIIPLTIHVDSGITNETVKLTFINNLGSSNPDYQCYIDDKIISPTTGKMTSRSTDLNAGLKWTPYVLNNATANSVAILNQVSVPIETNESIFDGNIAVFSELSKIIANSSDEYYLNYTSSNEDVIKFYNYSVKSVPKYVVLKGTNKSEITVNLTNKTDGSVIDSKKFNVSTTPITLNADVFNYTANHTYPYGSDINGLVMADVKASILNHSIGAADSGDDAYAYGYIRDVGSITLTFFNDPACTNPVVSFDGGTYYFNVSIAANENYNAVKNMTIANNSFVVTGALVYGKCMYNTSLYNATTPARMIVEFNATGMDLNASFFNVSTIVNEYKYGNVAHIYLKYNETTYTGSPSNFTIASDNSTITFVANTNPIGKVTTFTFEGFPRGDVNLDHNVKSGDASELGAFVADPTSGSLTNEQLFYADIYGYGSLSVNEVRQIARFSAGQLTPDYITKSE